MKPSSRIINGALSAMLTGVSLITLAVPLSLLGAEAAYAAKLARIDVRGNQRVSADTIRSYLGIKQGENFSADDIDAATKALFNTGLFADVNVSQSGSTIVVTVVEQAIVAQPIFQGNKKIKDKDLAARVQLQPRSPFSQSALDADIETIRDAYRATGRNDVTVNAETMDAGDGRVNVIFNISEGDRTKINSVVFSGNDAIGDGRLRSVVNTKRSNILSKLLRDDIYSDDKLRADEDKLRQYYFNRGYADFRVVSGTGEFDTAANAYNVAFTVEEGNRYNFGEITIDSTVEGVDTAQLAGLIKTTKGKVYSARDVENTLIAISERLANQGFAFAQVTPRGDRNFTDNTISITYTIDQGPRVYIERIEIRGNDRTRDFVIRREFDVSEGDAFNQFVIQKARKRLEALGYFARVNISSVPGSEPDRVVIVVDVEDQSTGDIGIGAGYAIGGESAGVQLEGSISERNFLGRGQFLKLAVGGSTDSRTYTISFTEPYLMGSRISAGFDIQRATKEYAAGATTGSGYDTATQSATIRFGLPITDALSAQLAYNYSQDTYTCKTPADKPTCTSLTATPNQIDVLINEGSWTKSSLSASLVYSTLDNRADPRNGLFVRGTLEYAGIGGDANFVKATATGTYYHLLAEDLDIVAVATLAGGHIEEIGSSGIRNSDLFRSSTQIIRGFDSNGIGPYNPGDNLHVGGDTYFKATAEVQFPLPLVPESFGLRGAVFADAATIHGNNLGGTLVSTDLAIRSSVGVGIAWASPFGPLRIDYAIPVQKEATDKVREFSFGISTRF
jgi:outer membrane protein insertion porin family